MLKLNLVGFPIPTDYPQGLGWFKKPLKSLGDLNGMKVPHLRHRGGDYGKLGVAVVTVPGGEIVPAMERGVIEGAEWINCLEDKKLATFRPSASTRTTRHDSRVRRVTSTGTLSCCQASDAG